MTWRAIDSGARGDLPVLVRWSGSAPYLCRLAVWREARVFQRDEFGPGWVCYFTGTPLTDKIDRYMPVPQDR